MSNSEEREATVAATTYCYHQTATDIGPSTWRQGSANYANEARRCMACDQLTILDDEGRHACNCCETYIAPYRSNGAGASVSGVVYKVEGRRPTDQGGDPDSISVHHEDAWIAGIDYDMADDTWLVQWGPGFMLERTYSNLSAAKRFIESNVGQIAAGEGE